MACLTQFFRNLHSRRAAPWVALLVSGGLLGGAYIFQYGFGYYPCTMCYWQRHAHKAVLILAVIAWKIHRFGDKAAELFRWLLVLAFLVSFGIAAWHVGVEFGLLEGPKTCSGGVGVITPITDVNDPLAIFDNNSIKPPACSEAVWHFLGLSMAAWNALVSLIAAGWIATSRKT